MVIPGTPIPPEINLTLSGSIVIPTTSQSSELGFPIREMLPTRSPRYVMAAGHVLPPSVNGLKRLSFNWADDASWSTWSWDLDVWALSLLMAGTDERETEQVF